MLVILGKMGLDTMLLRFVAAFTAKSVWGELNGVLRFANRWAVVSGVTLFVLGEAVLWYFSGNLRPNILHSWQVGFFLVPVLVLSGLRQESLRGLKHIVPARLPENILLPLVMLSSVFFWTRAA